ncbi:MAG: hypothetical protein AB7I13_06335 [Vicinamibacterales bacterium]
MPGSRFGLPSWNGARTTALIGAVALLPLLSATTGAQAPAGPAGAPAKPYTPPKTAHGQPDLQGVWDFRNVIPLERPAQFADKEFLTDEEVAEYERTAGERLDMDRRDDDPNRTPAVVNGQRATADVARAYNDFWWDFGKKFVGSKRSSLIIDPKDGKLPAYTPAGKKRVDDDAARRARAAEGPEDRGVGERCILGFNAGPPMLPSAYNNNIQLFQSKDHVVILNEMVHDARIVPIDGRAHKPVPQWSGSSRGRFEGSTLVVETKGFQQNTSFPGSSPNMQVVERFTRVGPDQLMYEFTVTDPTTWTKPFTAQVPMVRSSDHMYEYACHEGNYGMEGILSGARSLERAGAVVKPPSTKQQ